MSNERDPSESLSAFSSAANRGGDPVAQALEETLRDGRPSLGWIVRHAGRAGDDGAPGVDPMLAAWRASRDAGALRRLLRHLGRGGEAAWCPDAVRATKEAPHPDGCPACVAAVRAAVARPPTLGDLITAGATGARGG